MCLRSELGHKSVSPLIATILLIVATLLTGGILIEGLGKLGAPPMPPQTVVQLWTNYPGYGGIAIVHASGEGITKAYRADILEETPMGTLLENIRWQNIELRVNGVRVENEIDLALITGPVKKGMNDLPGPGEALVLCFKGENLKIGDKVELIYTPMGYKIAETIVPEPTPGRAYVDTAIQLRAARMLGRQEATVKAIKEKRFSDARKLAYELQNIARDLHENYLARSKYLENSLWELHRYMPDLVDENLCKTLIVIYEGCLPYLINALEAIDNIIYKCLHVYDPTLLQAVKLTPVTVGGVVVEGMNAAAENSKIIMWNISMVENLRWNSKYYTPLPGENKDSPQSKIRRMEILTAIPGGFVQDLSRDLYIPFLTPWVERLEISMSGGFHLAVRIYNLGTTRVENIVPRMYMWFENYSNEGEDSGDAAFWVSRYFNKGSDMGNGFSRLSIESQFWNNPLQPMTLQTVDMWQHIVWNYGWPRLPYPTKCEGQYWWVEEHQLVERFRNWGLAYDLNENNHPIIEYFRRYTGLSVPYTGEGGRAGYAGDPISSPNVVWSRSKPLYLNPGGDYIIATYDVSCLLNLDFLEVDCGLNIDAQPQLVDMYLVGDDAFWGRKTELTAFAAMW
ncbi:MAG: hypothetical protein QW788_05745, partial [Candidatus Hadarchaeales archaeon]